MKRLALLLLPVLAACSSLPSPSMPSMPDFSTMVTPYRIDVRQGNQVTQEMVAQLKPGMSKDQVRFALGTPLLKDMFHGDRWDYVYLFHPGKGQAEERKIAVFFDAQGRLQRLGGDVAPMGSAPAEPTPPQRVIEIAAPPSKDDKLTAKSLQLPTEAREMNLPKETPASTPAAQPPAPKVVEDLLPLRP